MGRRVLIFCWHNVAPTPFFASGGAAATDGFRRQMRLLKQTAVPIGLPDAVERLAEGRPLPPRAVVVTFDDGYRDNLAVAAPILRQEGIPATFFLVPQFLSSPEAPWWDRLAWAVRGRRRGGATTWADVPVDAAEAGPDATLGRLAAHLKTLDEADRQQSVKELVELFDPAGGEPSDLMMDWDEARQLAGMGFTIGSHSSRHAILSNEAPDAQLDDLSQARILLEQGIGPGVDLLAYPNGTEADFSHATIRAARRAGYRAAVTTIDGWNDARTPPYALRRFVMLPQWGPAGFAVIGRHLARQARSTAGLGRH